MSSFKDMTKNDLSNILKNNGVKGISRLNKDDLVKLVKKVNRNMQKGGQENSGATFLPAQWYNPSAKLASPQTDMMTAYGKANPVSGSCRNLAAFPNSSGQQTGGRRRSKTPKKNCKHKGNCKCQKGGQESSGATFLPSRWFNPKADLANPATDMMTAYGKTNPVSGSCRNLAVFPNSSGQQTGGRKNKK